MWSLSTLKNINSINVLQKKCLRFMNFSPYNSHTNILFKLDKILKVEDLIRMEQLKLAYQFKKGMLPLNIMEFLKSNINVYCTRNMEKGGLIVPLIRSVTYDDKTLRYAVPTVWNKYIKLNNYDSIRSIYHFKSHFKKMVFESYNT